MITGTITIVAKNFGLVLIVLALISTVVRVRRRPDRRARVRCRV